MKNLITLIVLLAIGASAMAKAEGIRTNKEPKEYRFTMNSGKLLIEMNNVTVEGYDGKEVIISMMVETKEEDKRAAGLVGISGQGLRDNTGMGMNVEQSEGVATIRLMNASHNESAVIKVPRQLALSIVGTRTYGAEKITVKNINGELEVATTVNDISLESVTGPMTVKTATGNIEAIFDAPVKGPISLTSSAGFIDLALPVRTKANIDLRNTLGEIYAAEEFNIDFTAGEKKQPSVYENTGNGWSLNEGVLETGGLTFNISNSSILGAGTLGSSQNAVIGTINGGGEHISIRTAQGKIYLRTTEK